MVVGAARPLWVSVSCCEGADFDEILGEDRVRHLAVRGGTDGVRSTWTISSTCANPTDCVGTLTSDLGWTADIYKKSGMWYVRHVVPGWQPCPDGTAVDGLQLFTFYAGDPLTGQQLPDSDTYLGDDITTSVSGACGINKQLVVQMPFKMVAA